MTSRFPHPPTVEAGGRTYAPAEVVARLAPYLTEARRRRIADVVARRTYTVVPVLERVHDLGNVNAVLRSAEGLGYGAAHLVDLQSDAGEWAALRTAGAPLQETRAAQRQSQGADKWIDLQIRPDAASACTDLRDAGYRIVATHLSADAVPIAEIDFSEPTAIVLGNERDGVSEAMLALADANCVLPIDGFIQSYNISVAAALALYHARHDRLARLGRHGDLPPAEQEILTAHYYLRSVRAPEALLTRGAPGA